MEQRLQIAREQWRIFADHFRAPFKNVRGIQGEKDRQDRSKSIEWFSISDTTDKPEKANIQGGEIHLLKLSTMG